MSDWRPCCGQCGEEFDVNKPGPLTCEACGAAWDGSEVGQNKPTLVRTEGQWEHKGQQLAPGLLQPEEVPGTIARGEYFGGDESWDAALGSGELVPCEVDWMPTFLGSCLRSGMVEAICHNCGRPWLCRRKEQSKAERQRSILFMKPPELPKLCPVCDPDHIGYEPGGPSDRERWFNAWRRQLLQVFAQRSAERLLLVERSVWVDVPLALYECRPRSGGEITAFVSKRFGTLNLGNLQHSPRPRLTFAGGAYLTGWFPAGDSILARMEPAVQSDPRGHIVYYVPFNERPVLR